MATSPPVALTTTVHCMCACNWVLVANDTSLVKERQLQLLIAASDNPLETKPDPLLFCRPTSNDDSDSSQHDGSPESVGPATLDLQCPPGLCFAEELVIMSNARWIELSKGSCVADLEYATSCAGEQVDGDVHVAFVPTEGMRVVRLKFVSLPKHQPDLLKLHLLQVATKPAPRPPTPPLIPTLPEKVPANLSALVGLMSLLPLSSNAHSSQPDPDSSSIDSNDRDVGAGTSHATAAMAVPPCITPDPPLGSSTDMSQSDSPWDRLFDRLDAFEAKVMGSFGQVHDRLNQLEARMAKIESQVAVRAHGDSSSPSPSFE